MIYTILWTFLISLSPIGEARLGIPYGVLNELNLMTSFIVGLAGNILVFPLFYKFIETGNKYLMKNKIYKKAAIKISLRARLKSKNAILKYGSWGLMVFVMIPLPVTGAYMGTIAAYIFGVQYKKAIISVSIGITISSALVTALMFIV